MNTDDFKFDNYVSLLNLYTQQRAKRGDSVDLPFYKTLQKQGADHKPTFTVSCVFLGETSVGVGPNVKAAKEKAADGLAQKMNVLGELLRMRREEDYSLESYSAPLPDIWNGKDATLVLRKRVGDFTEYKTFKLCAQD